METHGIAVFDVCGTITKTNNTFDFVAFVLRRDRTFRYGLLLLLRILAALFHLLGIRRVFRRDILRDAQIALLRGYPGARIRELSELYVEGLFAEGRLNDAVLDAMEKEKSQGRTVLLVSSAIDPPIAALARRLDVESYFSSELEMADGHYTGGLKTDLLGHKQSVLTRLPVTVDWETSSVYSDNTEDAEFMARFGRRHVVLNTPQTRRIWEAENQEFDFIINYDERRRDLDVDSVNPRTVKWVYLPPLYYVISRFHRKGVFTLFVREIVPVTAASYLLTDLGAFSFFLMPLSFLMFYAIYEIGGLVNDLAAKREAPREEATHRIAAGVHLHVGLFVLLRLALVGVLLALLALQGYPVRLYAGALGGCLAVFLLHTLILGHGRVVTFFLLKICRNSVPLLLLAHHVPSATLISLCAIFSTLDAPWRMYVYARSRGLAGGKMPVPYVRCLNTVLLWGLGVVLCLANGWPHLLAIASYFVVLDCLGAIRS